MQENDFTGCANKVQGKAAATPGNAEKYSDFKRSRKVIIQDPLTLRAASCTMGVVGRLAQRLERSVYTRKVVRSNRTVPTIRAQHPSAGT